MLLNEDTDHQIEDAFSSAGSRNSVNYQSSENSMYDQSHFNLDFSSDKISVYPPESNTNQNESITLTNGQNTSRHDSNCQQHRLVSTCLRNSEGDKLKIINKDPINSDVEIDNHLGLDGSNGNSMVTNTNACAQCQHNSSQRKDYHKYQRQVTTNSTRLQSKFSHGLNNQASSNLDHNYRRNTASDSDVCPCHQHQAAHHANNATRQCRSCSFVGGNLIDSCRSCAKHAGCQLSCAMCSNAIAGTCLSSNNSIVCVECHSKSLCCATSQRFRNSTVDNFNTVEHLVNNQQCRHDKDNVADIINSKICSQESTCECKSHSSCYINSCQQGAIHQSSSETDQNLSTCSLPDGSDRTTYATHINQKGNHYISEKNQNYLLSYDSDHNTNLKPCASCDSISKSQETLNLSRIPDNETNQVLRILNPDGSVTTLPLNTPMVATVSDRQLSISVQQKSR